jgi:hypothetical protein
MEDVVGMRAQRRVIWLGLAVAAAMPRPARADAPAPEVTERVQRRFVEKAGRIELVLGFSYLERSDFYRHPGAQASASYWLREPLALELAAAVYASVDTDELAQVERETGLVPDSRRERATLQAGARYCFGYGKMLIRRGVVHFDPQLYLRAGVHFAEGNVGPMTEIGAALAARPGPRWVVRLDLGLTLQGERRSAGWEPVLGFAPVLSLGALL